MENTGNKMRQLQQAVEGDGSITGELKDYMARLQDKLARVRSLGGDYGRVDFSPFVKAIQDQEMSATVVVESKQRARSGKVARSI